MLILKISPPGRRPAIGVLRTISIRNGGCCPPDVTIFGMSIGNRFEDEKQTGAVGAAVAAVAAAVEVVAAAAVAAVAVAAAVEVVAAAVEMVAAAVAAVAVAAAVAAVAAAAAAVAAVAVAAAVEVVAAAVEMVAAAVEAGVLASLMPPPPRDVSVHTVVRNRGRHFTIRRAGSAIASTRRVSRIRTRQHSRG